MAAAQPQKSTIGAEFASREMYFFNLFRILEAAIVVGLMFSPLATGRIQVLHPKLGHGIGIAYLLFALAALSIGTRSRHDQRWIDVSLIVDILVIALAMFAIRDQHLSLALLLLVNLGGVATLRPRRISFHFAWLASLGVFAQAIAGRMINHDNRDLIEAAICGMAYLSVTALCLSLGKQMHESTALASRRGVAVRNLSQLNELIIRRMRTGVLVVDGARRVHRWNEAARALLGDPDGIGHDLQRLSPELAQRLLQWRQSNRPDNSAVALAADAPKVIPRFTRLSAAHDDGSVLIFLDDAALVSRRAEQLTLSSLGRLSASIAHEIRNPLAAISYSSQLLAESPRLDDADRRMLQIIRTHTHRMNDIVENILHLARRERSMPESLDLAQWIGHFVEDYKAGNDLGQNELTALPQAASVEALADPRQLQQVVWNLVQNALRHGHLPDRPAHVSVIARHSPERGLPTLEVVDRGPGIAPEVAAQIFEPFYTTHEFGTGLGLYLARQMCEANQATIDYLPVPGGGSCFRIVFPLPSTT